jgi:peroxiredoxin Q/BCP
MIARVVLVATLSAAVAAPGFAQQADPSAPKPGPDAGVAAPDFTAPGANKDGTLKAPVHLADLKGKTVVLAFFPKARTSGCTQQMTQYREQYATLFDGGKNIVLLGISIDADTTLANWAKEANFPFQFVSDKDGDIGRAYGTIVGPTRGEQRYVYVIGPDGKIAYTKKPFSPFTPAQYDTLGIEIHKTLKK